MSQFMFQPFFSWLQIEDTKSQYLPVWFALQPPMHSHLVIIRVDIDVQNTSECSVWSCLLDAQFCVTILEALEVLSIGYGKIVPKVPYELMNLTKTESRNRACYT